MLSITSISFSQEVTQLEGQIEANNPDIDKIHVINLTLKKGTVTGKTGEFQIVANAGDSLLVSSVQFQKKNVIVTHEMILSKKIKIQLEENVNELAEVVIDDIQLSGYLANDLAQISIRDLEEKYKLQGNLNSFIEKDRRLNPYEQPNPVGGIRLDKVANAILNKMASNKENTIHYTPKELVNKSIAIVGHKFFSENLKLNDNEICNFLFFCADDFRFNRLVINNNAFVLIEYFQSRINDFREIRGSALNAQAQIPG